MGDLCGQPVQSAFGEPRHDVSGRPGPPVEDDQVQRTSAATAPDRLSSTGMSEYATAEGELHLCAVKDVHGNLIVG